MRPINVLLVCVLLITTACKTKVTNSKVEDNILLPINYSYDTNALITDIKTLSSNDFEGRRTGTKGAEKAKQYIIDRFADLKVNPLGAHYEQNFNFEARGKSYQATNILSVIKGTTYPEKYIVLSAHYDHEGIKNGEIYNGADDDASGVSALFALAEYFKKHAPKHSIIFAAFDGEELGLKGAYHFVDNIIIPQENIVLNINMDMISRSEDNSLFAVGTRYTNMLKPIVAKENAIGKVDLKIGHEGLDNQDNWTFSSDHAAFYKAKIPFIYFGVPDHKDYHKPTDDFENIDQEFYKDAVETILNVTKKADALTF